MFEGKLFYYLANYTLQHSFEKEIIKLIKNKRKLVVFDVGLQGEFLLNNFKFNWKKKT